MKFNLFLSYTRTPDGALAREIERFLEAFHQTLPPAGRDQPLPQLQICLDGSDFSLPPIDADATEAERRDVLGVILAHLAQSRELLVLGSRGAARSKWVDDEVRWFIEHSGAARVRLAFTEGEAPWESPGEFFPPSVVKHGLHEGIAYDLRGYDAQRSAGWHQVPEYQREMVRLAADLCGLSAGDLYPSWLEAELARVQRESLAMTSTARFETLAGDPCRAVLRAYEAHELHPGDASELALRDAYKTAVLHHHNRREIARISGSGPKYLAGRWKQGEIFTRTSPDGRYRLLVTERGKDGPHPPGDVYLVSNETLRAVKLEPRDALNYRVEDVSFDRRSRFVFITRYFHLDVYTIEGRRVGGYKFSRHTKSPVHLVDGYFHDRYILGAETKGGVWLVDIDGDRDSTLQVRAEYAGAAALACDIAPDGTLAALIFESGAAALLALDDDGQPSLTPIDSEDIVFAGFTDEGATLLTAGRDGVIAIWEIAAGTVRETDRLPALPAPVDWISIDENRKRFAAVGADQRIYILHRETGELIETLDYRDAVDWAAARSVPVSGRDVNPGSAVEFGEPVPFPSESLHVANVGHAGGATWLFTEEPGDNEYSVTRRTFRLRDGEVRSFPYAASLVEAHSDILWFRYAPGYGGRAYWRTGDFLRPFPASDLDVACVFDNDGTVLTGTRTGGYAHREQDHWRVAPASMRVENIAEVGGCTWLYGEEGAYKLDGDRLIRVTEPFVGVTSVLQAGGFVWLLTRADEMFVSGGPAYRVEGCFAFPKPHAQVQASAVFDAGGYAWVAEARALHRVGAEEIRTIEGIEPDVDALLQTGRTLWLTTHSCGLMAGRGPSYRMDVDTLKPQTLDRFGTLQTLDDRGWLSYTRDAKSAVAEVREDGLHELELNGGVLQGLGRYRGDVWLLTSEGVYESSSVGVHRVDLPRRSYHALIELGKEAWLLAKDAAVRLRPGTTTVFETGEQRPSNVVRVNERTWILTVHEDFSGEPGPAYRVGAERARAVAPPQGGVCDVVDIDGTTWLLTRKGSLAGPLLKA